MSVYHDDAAQELDSPIGIVGVQRGGSGADLSDDGPGVLVQATLGAPVTVVALSSLPSVGQLSLLRGGTGSDLSDNGPGWLYQASLGGNVTTGMAAVYDAGARGLVVGSSGAAAANAAIWTALLAEFVASSHKSAIFLLPPGEIYMNAETQITSSITDNKTLRVIGFPPGLNGTGGTTLRASTAMRSVLAVLAPRVIVDCVGVNADRLATYGWYMSNIALSVFTRCSAKNAIVDGFHVPTVVSANNNTAKFVDCYSTENGVTYVTSGISGQYTYGTRSVITGTAETTAGNATITIAGSSTDLTTLPIRKGDVIRVGSVRRVLANSGVADYTAGSDYMQISSVTATTVVLQGNSTNLPTFTGTGLNFAIGVGDGFRDIRHADSNVIEFDNCRFVTNGGSGLVATSVYGPLVSNGNYSYNNMCGFVIGYIDNTSATIGTQINHAYVEDVGAAYFPGETGSSINIISPMGISVEAPGSELFFANRSGHGLVLGNGTITSIELGTFCNFVCQVRNNGGTIEHRTIDDTVTASATNARMTTRVTGTSTTYTATPSAAAGVDFATGFGIDNTAAQFLLLNQMGVQQDIAVTAIVESDSSGAASPYSIIPTVRNVNVNGVTKRRLAFQLTLAGVATTWAAANITAGGHVAFRVQGYIR